MIFYERQKIWRLNYFLFIKIFQIKPSERSEWTEFSEFVCSFSMGLPSWWYLTICWFLLLPWAISPGDYCAPTVPGTNTSFRKIEKNWFFLSYFFYLGQNMRVHEITMAWTKISLLGNPKVSKKKWAERNERKERKSVLTIARLNAFAKGFSLDFCVSAKNKIPRVGRGGCDQISLKV